MNESGTTGAEPRGEGVTAANACAIKLPVFEGPLDLLLHLIRLNEVDVTDLPIAAIAQQYGEYVSLMHELDLDVAGEYLLMAAMLAWIKSRMLLPPSGEGEEEEAADPRAELVARLIEYQRFKEAAEQLGERSLEGRDVFAARTDVEPPPDEERPLAVSLVALLEAFRRVLAKTGGTGRHEVTGEPVSVRDRMLAVMDALARFDSLEFERVFELEGDQPPTRRLLIATFLAVLELVRLAAVRAYQGLSETGAPEGPIRLRRAEGPGADDWSAAVAEIT